LGDCGERNEISHIETCVGTIENGSRMACLDMGSICHFELVLSESGSNVFTARVLSRHKIIGSTTGLQSILRSSRTRTRLDCAYVSLPPNSSFFFLVAMVVSKHIYRHVLKAWTLESDSMRNAHAMNKWQIWYSFHHADSPALICRISSS
jgi:hypothetical protein